MQDGDNLKNASHDGMKGQGCATSPYLSLPTAAALVQGSGGFPDWVTG